MKRAASRRELSILCGFLIGCVSMNAAAKDADSEDDSAVHLHPMFLLGAGGGGEKLAELKYTDGTSSTVSAGGGVQMGAGLVVDFTRIPLQLQASGAYFFQQANASNGHIMFSRWPLEALGFFKPNDWFRVGGGLQYALAPKFEAELNGGAAAIHFNSAPGLVVETGVMWLTSYSMGFNLRFVLQGYSANTVEGGGATVPVSGERINGNHFGGNLFFGF